MDLTAFTTIFAYNPRPPPPPPPTKKKKNKQMLPYKSIVGTSILRFFWVLEQVTVDERLLAFGISDPSAVPNALVFNKSWLLLFLATAKKYGDL